MSLTRRRFLHSAIAVSAGFGGLRRLLASGGQSEISRDVRRARGFGPLLPDPQRILDLPAGFSYSVISRIGDRMDDGFYVPGDPDGMAAFPGPDGKVVLVRNHELDAGEIEKSPYGRNNELLDRLPPGVAYDLGHGKVPCLGGTTTMLYDPRTRRVERQFLSLAGTENNCAGGPTPWGSWLTCEETTIQAAPGSCEQDHGYVFEVPARLDGGPVKATPLRALGRYRHEAVAIDPHSGCVYLTEDLADGLIYRFVPNKPGELLAGGRLQALCARDSRSLDTRNWLDEPGRSEGPSIAVGARLAVRWMDLDDIQAPKDDLRLRGFAAGAARFARGEGMWYGRNAVYWASTEGGRVQAGQIWRYTPSPAEATPGEVDRPGVLELFIEPNDRTLLENADNVTVAPWGDLVICEDGENDDYLVGVTPDGKLYKLARNARGESEFAGTTFSPDGGTLFVNIQENGRTLAITGPWDRRQADV